MIDLDALERRIARAKHAPLAGPNVTMNPDELAELVRIARAAVDCRDDPWSPSFKESLFDALREAGL